MAEGYEPYHVPQQSRRERLRVVVQNNSSPGCVDNIQGCAGLVPLYDPSLVPSDLLTCASLSTSDKTNKESLMGYVGGVVINNASTISSSSSASHHHLYMDPQSCVPINPSSFQHHDVNGNPLFLDQNFPEPSSIGGGQEAGKTGQGLSLSLSSNQTHLINLPLELNLPRYESYVVPGIVGGGGASVSFGPFIGYASILKGSRFLKPAQQLLEEICDVARGVNYDDKVSEDSGLMDPTLETLGGNDVLDDSNGCTESGEQRKKKSRLVIMLDEVYRRYKHYYQQMQVVVASFESVAGLSNAAPFANLALRAMSKHFKCLKNAIADQLQFTIKSHCQINYGKGEIRRFGSATERVMYSQRPVYSNSGFAEHQPVWRPQRGLPERAVTVLRAWLFEHFLHPYPTDNDKIMLAKQTGLSRNQVSNWFINARVRLWKPMVEEIHMLETQQAQKSGGGGSQKDQNSSVPIAHLSSAAAAAAAAAAASSLASENPSTSTRRIEDIAPKRTRKDFQEVPMGSNEEPLILHYESLSRHSQHMGGLGVSTGGVGGGNGGVSLTLGLHQNHGIGLSESSFPMNAARRFGLASDADAGFVLGVGGGGFEAASGNQQFGRNFIGGQLLHDFVG